MFNSFHNSYTNTVWRAIKFQTAPPLYALLRGARTLKQAGGRPSVRSPLAGHITWKEHYPSTTGALPEDETLQLTRLREVPDATNTIQHRA